MLKLDFTLNEKNRLAVTGARSARTSGREILAGGGHDRAAERGAHQTGEGASVIARETAVLVRCSWRGGQPFIRPETAPT